MNKNRSLIVGSDAAVMIATVLLVSIITIDADLIVGLRWTTEGSTWLLGGSVVLCWLASLAMEGVWSADVLANGARETRRTLMASLMLFAGVGIFGYLAQSDLARPYLLIAAPVGVAGLLLNHSLWRRRFEPSRSARQQNAALPGDLTAAPDGAAPSGSGPAAHSRPAAVGAEPSRGRTSGWLLVVRNALDLIVAMAGILLLSPLLLVAAIVIPLTDGGPVLHQQAYVGRAGRVFTGWTFRCTPYGAKARPAAVGASSFTRRAEYCLATTSVGSLLRRTGLASTPLLFNVLIGQMSVVGPQPLTRENSGQQTSPIRPGITGRWRVGPWPADDPGERVDDENSTLTSDVRVVARTVRLGVTGRLSR